ncbi:GFA family protein [Georhizobium profundi]|uniref:GFA family protein n=2 Tax=Georhizobium profundi TaxID=2341112 RepID=A0A3S9B9Y8_9HYPH|nr:GFA family protein [Georhizobium profundi]
MVTTRVGGCLCGAVRYSVVSDEARPMRGIFACHCVECRRQSGHYVAATAASDDALTVTGGDNLTWFAASPEAKRGFCRICGSLLFWKADARSSTSIMAGSLDGATGLMIDRHIFAAEKGDYYTIDDNRPVYEDAGPS